MNKSTTDTPRTDAEAESTDLGLYVYGDFARQLERELAEAKTEVERLRNGMQGSCYCCEPVGIMNQKLKTEVEFWKAKAHEAEFYEGKHEAEVERLQSGFQGSCYCCEPVGILNQKLEAEVERLRALLKSNNFID
jgi:hypothetical protein